LFEYLVIEEEKEQASEEMEYCGFSTLSAPQKVYTLQICIKDLVPIILIQIFQLIMKILRQIESNTGKIEPWR